ncbi:MAG: MFS transporter [Candidatus Bathyarchaeota archaeon]
MGVRSSLKNGRDFLARQSHNYRMMIVRSGGGMFLFNLTGQYSSIFTKALGADNMTIAWLSSVSSFISMLISMPVGYVTDNYNLKKVMGAGLFLNIAMVGMYAFALDWRWIFVAMVINPFTMALMFRSQQVIITNELDSAERARGMGVRMQIAMILGLISPIPAAFLVKSWGGLTLEGIRPLYYIRFVGMIIIYSYVYIKLTDVLPMPRAKKSTGFLDDFREVLDEGGRKLKVMIVVGALGALVWSTIQSFTYLYAAEIKGADELILGLLPTVETIAYVLFATPMNNLADTKGRKYAFLLVRPALWLFFVLVILAPNQYWLLVAWFLRGIGMSTSAYNTLFLEMVPAEQRGRWMGLSNTFSALIRIGAPLLGGLMYDSNLPWLLFAVPLAVDMLIRIPIFHFYVPETLPKQE